MLAITAHGTTLTVKSLADSGGTCPGSTCTLRQAIATADPGDTINFSLPANSTITLTSAELLISRNLTIIGPGANLLTVQRSTANGTQAFRIFDIAGSNLNVTISGLTVTNGSDQSNGGGGGIFNSATLTLAGVIISGNNTVGNIPNGTSVGGGILNSGTLTITNCTISANTVSSSVSAGGFPIVNGGGILNSGTLTVTNSTISGNSATAPAQGAAAGGGIVNNRTLTITNSTISGNSATGGESVGGASGGGILSSMTLTVTNSTISGNEADNNGGGIDSNSGTVNVRNTIIAKNLAFHSPDIFGPVTSQGFNLIGNNSGGTITPTTGDQIGISTNQKDPMLGPLQDNGGPTRTMALLSGSTAIEMGNSSGSITDQRGFARPVDSPTIANASGSDGSDIGAYEVQADQLPGCSNVNTVVNNNNDSGTASLRSVLANVCAGSTITFTSNVTGAINLTSGELLIDKSLTINGPGANVLTVQRSAANGTQAFRIFDISSLANNYNVSISGLTIANGQLLSDAGAGIASNDGTLTLTNVTISGNTASAGGGGIVNASGTLTISNSTISGNSSTGNSGGGILNTGKLTVTNSTISGNTVSGSGNDGGGIAGGTMIISSSTIAGNSASPGNGGGIALDGGSLTCRNTIIALNTAPAGPDVNGTLTSQGFNFIGNSSGATILSAQFTDQIGAGDPSLGPLRDNGGSTLTRALLTGSKAIDTGDSGGATSDQRGFTRPVDFSGIANAGDGADIGAFELQLPTPSPTPTSTPTATPPTTAQALNIATRMSVQGGNNVLIAGFIVSGTDQKTVAVRGIGPSLSQFFSGALVDPTLELHSGNVTLDANDNWQDNPAEAAQLSANGLGLSDPHEAGIFTTVAPGQFTAILAGKNDGAGIGLVELYDLDQAANSQLANISTRGFVQTGNNVMIGGFILGGNAGNTRIAVRGIGPSLAQFGLSPLLADPTLELHDANGATLAADDDWQDDPAQAAQLSANGLALSDPKEAGLFTSLPPGQFTAILAGKNGGIGIGLVEIYNLH